MTLKQAAIEAVIFIWLVGAAWGVLEDLGVVGKVATGRAQASPPCDTGDYTPRYWRALCVPMRGVAVCDRELERRCPGWSQQSGKFVERPNR